jgi:hypothetical protein
VTHSPCKNKFLGKLDRISRKMQMRCPVVPRRDDHETEEEYKKAMETELSFIMEESERHAPFHIFGHIAFQNVMRLKNKINIDTGCAHGGKLTAASIKYKPDYTFVPALKTESDEHEEKLIDIYRQRDINDFNLDTLDPREATRVRWTARDKVNFISGTMAPAEADAETNNLESFHKAVEYYKKMGVKRCVLQPKYMGSRCNVYLNKDIDKCYATSRRGFIIKKVELKPAFMKLLQHKGIKALMEHNDAEWLIIDSELLPWHALGEGLIEEQYKVVEAGIGSELKLLRETGFEDRLTEMQQKMDESTYKKDLTLPRKELVAKHGHHNVATYDALHLYRHHSLDEHDAAFAIYQEQIELYGSPGEVDIKPFALLKVISNDGSEINGVSAEEDNVDMFIILSEDKCFEFDLEDSAEVEAAYMFYFKTIKQHKMEGVVMKPEQAFTSGVAPYLKVRSKAYLTLVYGYDYLFEEKYERLIKQKRTGSKLKTSIREYDIGRQMLDVTRDELTEDNIRFAKLAAQMIAEEKKEASFDPRL